MSVETLQIDSSVVVSIGGVVSLLLGVIAYFLNRLIKQFDALTVQFSDLNTTISKIDKDLSGEVGILKIQHSDLHGRMKDLDTIWDRVRLVEADVLVIKSALKPLDFTKGGK